MEIHRNNTVIRNIRPEDNSTQRVVHMGEDVLNLTFRQTTSLDLRINDYVFFDNKKYKLKKQVNPRKISRHEFEYSCQFFSSQYDLQDALYVLSDSTGVGELDDTIPLFGTLTFHAEQIVRCAREVHPEWELGEVEDFGEGKNIVYNDMDCLQALQHLAEEFNCEYWITGTVIHLGKRSEGEPLLFKYGKGNSLYDLSRTNQDGRIVTKLLVQGSNRNIDSATYGSATLRLPGGEKYVEKNVDKYGIIMGRQKFSDVYPRLIHRDENDPGSVTEAHFANGIYYIKDEKLNFNPGDCLLPGLSIKVVFQTGQLGGVKVEANWHSDTQEFELIRGDYGLGIDVPGSIFVPAVGDLYLLEDLKMPESYILDAENELLQKATEAINQICEQKVSYKGTLNYLYFKYLNDTVNVGRAVQVEDEDIIGPGERIDLRIQALTRNVNDPFKVDVEISDTMYIGRLDKIETSIREIKETIATTKVPKAGKGFAIFYRGVYEDIAEGERTFHNSRNLRDVVKYEDIYYIYKGADGAPNPVWIENNWEKFGDQFEAVATELLLAENANIAGWIFRNERLESQSGGAFLDGRTGEVNITGKFESSKEGKKIIIDPEERKIKMISTTGKLLLDIGFKEVDPNHEYADINIYSYDGDDMTGHTEFYGGRYMMYKANGNQPILDIGYFPDWGQYIQFAIDPTMLPPSRNDAYYGFLYRDGEILKIKTS